MTGIAFRVRRDMITGFNRRDIGTKPMALTAYAQYVAMNRLWTNEIDPLGWRCLMTVRTGVGGCWVITTHGMTTGTIAHIHYFVMVHLTRRY